MDPDRTARLRILADIRAGKAVSEDEGNWAVVNDYARHGEDGDIDLTHKGREAVDNAHV